MLQTILRSRRVQMAILLLFAAVFEALTGVPLDVLGF